MALPVLRRILNNTPGSATDIDYDFQTIQTHINTELVPRDGSVAFTAPQTGVAAVNPNELATLAQAQSALPVGVMLDYGGTSAPAGFALCEGQTESSTDPIYAALFAVIGYSYGDAGGGNFVLPDSRARVVMGAGRLNGTTGTTFAVGDEGGQADAELFEHNHTITHTHAITHGHTVGTLAVSSSGPHSHTGASLTVSGTAASVAGTDYLYVTTFSPTGLTATSGGPIAIPSDLGSIANHTHSVSGTATGTVGSGGSSHVHTLSGTVADHTGSSGPTSAADTGNAGAGTTLTNKNLQPYLVATKIIKL